jgi:peptide/nickel transport system substrate-binding protein
VSVRGSRRDFLRVFALGSGAALLAACVPPVAQPTTAPAKPAPPAAQPTAAPATSAPAQRVAQPTTAPAAAPAKPSGTSTGRLTIAHGVDPRSLWANSSTTQQEINVSEQITEKLIEFTPDNESYEPRLAIEWRQVDDTTFRMKLRQGVQFTNGEEFDAESARFSIETMINAPAYASFTGVIDGAEVVDKYTINVKTKSPTLLHQRALAMGSFQYPPRYFARLGQDEFGKNPVGTGPYTFAGWVRDGHVTLEANEGYWGGAPPMRTVTFRTIPEGAARLAALETGEVDFTIDVPLDAAERIDRNANLQLFSRPSNRIFYLVPSTLTDTPLKNAQVRKALWYAVDADGLIRSLFKGRATPLRSQILAKGFFGYDPSREPTPHDPARARQMLADAGFGSGFEITFKYPAGRYAQDKEAGQAIASQLAQVGIRARQEVLEPGTFLTQLSAKQLNDLYYVGALPPPDAHFQYQQFETGFRSSYYFNPRFDGLMKQGASTANLEERTRVYQQILDLFDQDPPYVPLFQPADYCGGKKALSGFTPRASQFLDIRTISLA